MKQVNTKSFAAFAAFCEDGVEGLHKYGADLEISRITDVILNGKLDAARKSNAEYQTSIQATLAALNAQDEARQQAIAFITATRDTLQQKLGSRYSKAWLDVGYVNATLAVPKAMETQLSLVKAMEIYFTAHPEAEVAVMALTSAHAAEVHAAYFTAKAAVSAARVVQRLKKEEHLASFAELRASRQLLFRELRTVLTDEDGRWLEFGFNIPGDVVTPEAPAEFSVAGGLPGHLSPSWSKSVGADRYRLFAQVVGVDEKPAAVETTSETSFDLGGFTSGAQVKLYVVAANAAGESLPSATVEVVVP